MGRKASPMTEVDRLIIRLRGEGESWRAIGRKVGMADVTVADRYRRFKARGKGYYSKPKARTDARQRTCLMCGNAFNSHGPGHRICRSCKHTHAWREGDTLGPYSFGSR